MGFIRVRQHVNPLAGKYQLPIKLPIWEYVYAQPQQPLHLDIGSAKGRFLRQMAKMSPERNFLGLEIREPLVLEANKLRDIEELTNLYYLFCNVNNSLSSLLSALPPGTLHWVTIQFPDPWFKARHAKRRVVQPELVAQLADYLVVGGMVFLQSDMEFMAIEMRDRFREHPAFEQLDGEDWLTANPLPVATEREIATLERNQPVYRTLFTRIG